MSTGTLIKLLFFFLQNLLTFTLNKILYFFKEFCLDLFEPSGNGKRRKRETDISRSSRKTINATNSTKFQDNLEYTVLMPGGIN